MYDGHAVDHVRRFCSLLPPFLHTASDQKPEVYMHVEGLHGNEANQAPKK